MAHQVKEYGSVANIVTIYGSSSEAKPTEGIAGGSVFVETDTQKIYLFDEDSATWGELA